MINTTVHVVLPKGLRLQNGMVLHKEVTLIFVSALTPFYCSVDQVRLAGGSYLAKLSDLTIACKIYEFSKRAETYCWKKPVAPNDDPESTESRMHRMFLVARQVWVCNMVALHLVQDMRDSTAGTRGSKTLANFSVTVQDIDRSDGMPKKITELRSEAEQQLIVLQSGGEIGPGGHVRGAIAAKQIYDSSSYPSGRLWINAGGMGANSKSIPGYGSGGAPVKYSSHPLVMWRYGRYYGQYMSMFSPYTRPW